MPSRAAELSDNLRLGVFEVQPSASQRLPTTSGRDMPRCPSWLSSLVCAWVLVICQRVELAHKGHAPSLTPAFDPVEAEALPHSEFCCLAGQQYYGLLRLLSGRPTELHCFSLYPSSRWVWATDPLRPLLFHRQLSPHPVLPTPEGSSRLYFQVLHRFHGLRYA